MDERDSTLSCFFGKPSTHVLSAKTHKPSFFQTQDQAAREKATESFKSVADVKQALNKGKQQEAKAIAEKATQQAQEAMNKMNQSMNKTRKTSEHDIKRLPPASNSNSNLNSRPDPVALRGTGSGTGNSNGSPSDSDDQRAQKSRQITLDVLVNFFKVPLCMCVCGRSGLITIWTSADT